jgi:DNA-binding ferritin-like protein (Dps family)
MSRLFAYFRYVKREKRRYKEMEVRAKALPEEYDFVYHKIQHYMWTHAGGDGMGMIPIFAGLLDLFEAGVADGKHVLEITGNDVAEFCDELLRNTKTWTADWHEALNRDIKRKLGKGNESK